MVARVGIVRTLDPQIQKEVQEFRTRLTHTRDLLREDIEEKVRREIKDWRVVQAIRNREPYPPSITDSVMDILEYGTDEGIITASKVGNDGLHSVNVRHGEKDLEALESGTKIEAETNVAAPHT